MFIHDNYLINCAIIKQDEVEINKLNSFIDSVFSNDIAWRNLKETIKHIIQVRNGSLCEQGPYYWGYWYVARLDCMDVATRYYQTSGCLNYTDELYWWMDWWIILMNCTDELFLRVILMQYTDELFLWVLLMNVLEWIPD